MSFKRIRQALRAAITTYQTQQPTSLPPEEEKERSTEQPSAVLLKEVSAGGNVTIEAHQHFPGSMAEDHTATTRKIATWREAYLSQLLAQCGQVFLSGIDRKAASQQTQPCLKLSAIYTALLTFGSDRSQDVRNKDQVAKMLMHLAEQRDRAASALSLVNQDARLVLLGDPGSGKSTFVNFLAMCLAGEALQHHEVNLQLLTNPLPEENGQDGEERQPWQHGSLLPVRVILRDLAATGLPPVNTPATVNHLWQFLTAEWEKIRLSAYLLEVEQHLREQGGLVLFDGLDEVPEANQRRVQIKQVVEAFAAAFPKCRIVVTSRTYAYYNQDWRLTGFHDGILAPFSTGQIVRFIDHWYVHSAEVRGMSAENAQGQAEVLKRVIFASPQLRNLAERPLLLTLMASLHYWRGGSLPDKREELYNDVVDLLLDWWESPKVIRDADGQYVIAQESLTELLRVGKDRVRKALNLLAFQAHASQEGLSGTADVAQDILVGTLLRVGQNQDLRPERLVEYLSDRAGLLVPRGVGVYTFPHRTFQEYLAACYLTDDNYPKKLVELACHDPNRWREVVLLAGAKAARGAASAVWLLAEALCWRQPDDPHVVVEDVWGAFLAGQTIAETVTLNHIEPYDHAKYERIRAWLVAILTEQVPQKAPFPSVERALAGNILAQFGDPRPGVGLRADGLPDIVWCNVPAGSFLMGSDKKKDPVADGDEQPQHHVRLPAYYISQYPVTNAQYRVFIENGGYRERTYWSKEGWKWKEQKHITEPDWVGGAFDLPNHPVVMVSWYEATAFCIWLTMHLQTRGDLRSDQMIRLPTEAEWEKAARGEDGRIYSWGNEIDSEHANYEKTGLGVTSTVGCFPRGACPYGCEDLAGNVWEWCLDSKRAYSKEAVTDPRGPDTGSYRVLRGGGWYGAAGRCRAAYRSSGAPVTRGDYVGFRLLRTPA